MGTWNQAIGDMVGEASTAPTDIHPTTQLFNKSDIIIAVVAPYMCEWASEWWYFWIMKKL